MREKDSSARQPMVSYMWGKRWPSHRAKAGNPAGELPPRITASEFWKGSAFGVAVGARSFPGISRSTPTPTILLNFENDLGFQCRIQELGSASGD